MDKTFCLQYLNDYDTIYFFGDKTNKVGLHEHTDNRVEMIMRSM